MSILLALEPTNMLDLNAIIWLENYLQVSLCNHVSSVASFPPRVSYAALGWVKYYPLNLEMAIDSIGSFSR